MRNERRFHLPNLFLPEKASLCVVLSASLPLNRAKKSILSRAHVLPCAEDANGTAGQA